MIEFDWSEMQLLSQALLILRDAIVCSFNRPTITPAARLQELIGLIKERADEIIGYDHPSADEDKEKIVNIAKQILEKVEL